VKEYPVPFGAVGLNITIGSFPSHVWSVVSQSHSGLGNCLKGCNGNHQDGAKHAETMHAPRHGGDP
jgi:hypothetical protein